MELALTFSDDDAARIRKHAAEKSMSVFDFAKRAVMKSVDEEDARAAKNAAYLAMIDESERQIREGHVVIKTMKELEAMAANE